MVSRAGSVPHFSRNSLPPQHSRIGQFGMNESGGDRRGRTDLDFLNMPIMRRPDSTSYFSLKFVQIDLNILALDANSAHRVISYDIHNFWTEIDIQRVSIIKYVSS